MRTLIISCFLLVLALAPVMFTVAQEDTGTTTAAATTSTSSAADNRDERASEIQERTEQANNTRNTTQPEQLTEKVAVLSLFDARPVDVIGPLSFMAFWVQRAVEMGIPANTIFLILLTPILATIVSLTRVVIGLPTLDMLVPIALSFVFVAMGVSFGVMILLAILLASYTSKSTLSFMRIMFYPKRSMSILFLAIFVFAALTIATFFDFSGVLTLSIFPILILMLLGDSIVSVQLLKSFNETFVITTTTIGIGLLGYALASSQAVRDILILYPELVLLTIPLNLMIGRYFGLRAVEYFRFNSLVD